MSIAEKLNTVAENVQKVFDAGKKSEYDAFWDAVFYDADGNYRYYMAYFFAGRGWRDENFKPKYDIHPTNSIAGLFRETNITDLKGCLESCGVTLDLSRATSATGAFGYGQLTILPKLDFSSITSATNTFNNATKLETIEELVVSETTEFSSNSFTNCTALTHMIMTGTLAKNGLGLHWSTLLDRESLLSIIDCLKDYSETGGTWTVTLGDTNLAKLTETEIAVATQKGWTLV